MIYQVVGPCTSLWRVTTCSGTSRPAIWARSIATASHAHGFLVLLNVRDGRLVKRRMRRVKTDDGTVTRHTAIERCEHALGKHAERVLTGNIRRYLRMVECIGTNRLGITLDILRRRCQRTRQRAVGMNDVLLRIEMQFMLGDGRHDAQKTVLNRRGARRRRRDEGKAVVAEADQMVGQFLSRLAIVGA